MPRIRRPALLAGLLAMLCNSACYAYQPAAGALRPDAGVRFQLTPGGTSELARYLGPNVVFVTGLVTDSRPGGVLTVAPLVVKTSNGIEQSWSGEGSVQFPRPYVRDLEQRTFNGHRTVLATILVTVGLVALASAALRTGGAHGAVAAGGGAPAP